MAVTPQDVEAAHAAIRDNILRTPTVQAPRLGEPLDVRLWLKLENLQYTGSFKDRGSCHKLQILAATSPKPTGVVAASAGNHAQGVAYSARKLSLNNIIVMPTTTPDIKVDAVKALGGNVDLHGDSFDQANRYAIERAEHEDGAAEPEPEPNEGNLEVGGEHF